MASKEHSEDINPPLQTQQVSAVGLKLPPYYPNDPQLWFMQVEAQFFTKGITQEITKYHHVVACLQPEYAQEVRDLLLSRPKDNPYTTLRDNLIKRTSASEQKRLHQLLTSEELGDRKPSQLLRRMEQLLGENQLEESIFKQLFLQRMPHHVQSILASSRDAMSVAQLADLADRIIEVRTSPSISSVTQSSDDRIAELNSKVDQLTVQINALTAQLHSRSGRSRSRSRGASGSKDRSRSRSYNRSNAHGQCWYHWNFGSKAKKCNLPCTYSSSTSSLPSTSDAENDKASS